MAQMTHMKLKWRAAHSGMGWVVETDVEKGGPLFYIARIYTDLSVDDLTGEVTAKLIAEQHNAGLEALDMLEHAVTMIDDLCAGYPEKELHRNRIEFVKKARELIKKGTQS